MEFKKVIGDAMASPFVRTGVLFVTAVAGQIAHGQTQNPAPVKQNNAQALQNLLPITAAQAALLADTPKIQACFDKAIEDLQTAHAKSQYNWNGEAKMGDNMICRVQVSPSRSRRGELNETDEQVIIVDQSAGHNLRLEAEGPEGNYLVQNYIYTNGNGIGGSYNVGSDKANQGEGPLAPAYKAVKDAKLRVDKLGVSFIKSL